METSILKTVKKILGIAADDTGFDEDILVQINSAFATLNQIGVGVAAFEIEDDTAVWADFLEGPEYNAVKTYVCLKVRSVFDPPQNGFAVTAMQSQITELEWRLNILREESKWVEPVVVV